MTIDEAGPGNPSEETELPDSAFEHEKDRNIELAREQGQAIPGGPLPTSSAAPRSAGELAKQADDPRAETLGRARFPGTAAPSAGALRAREQLHERINRDFIHHPPANELQARLYVEIRKQARAYAHFLVEAVPNGRELHRALSALEDVVYNANAGLARNGVDDESSA